MRRWKGILSVILVTAFLLSVGCAPLARKQTLPDCYGKVPKELSEQWKTNLNQYLQLSYVVSNENAGFGNLVNIFHPSLYSTYSVVGILKGISPDRVKDPDSVVKWINSLYNKEGFYCDPGFNVPKLEQTNWAISILKLLGSQPSSPQSIVQFLKSRQRKDGLFFMKDVKSGNSVKDYMGISYGAIQILQLIDITPIEAAKTLDIAGLHKTVLSYITKTLANGGPALKDQDSGYLISAIYILSYIDKNSVPKKAKEWIIRKIGEINTLPPDVLFYPSLINNLLDTAEFLSIQEAKEPDTLKQYLKEKIFPQENLGGGFYPGKENTNFIEPMLTYEVFKLSERSGLGYPSFLNLVHIIEIHRIKNGWINFVTFKPSAEATFYGLAIAKDIEITKEFSTDKILSYLTDIISSDYEGNYENNAVPMELRRLYYTVKAYKLVKDRIPPNLKLSIEDIIHKLSEELPSSETDPFTYALGMTYLVSISNEIHVKIEENTLLTIRKTAKEISQLLNNKKFYNIRLLYTYYTLSSALPNSARPKNYEKVICSVLNNLYIKNGFKRMWNMQIPYIDATYSGIYLSAYTKNKCNLQLNYALIKKFVMSSSDTYGFNYAPRELLKSAGLNTVPDIRATYYALWLLNYLNSLGQQR